MNTPRNKRRAAAPSAEPQAEPGAPDLPPILPVTLPPADDERPQLPRGGLVILRRSGGLRFSSREILVYRDGRLVVRELAPQRQERSAERLNSDELAALAQLLQHSGLQKLPARQGTQRSDQIVSEIVARIGRRAYACELHEGSIPANMAALLHWLLERAAR